MLNLDGSERKRQGPKVDLATYAALFYGFKVGTKEPWTLQEIGGFIGVGRERVRQIRAKYFSHLESTRTVRVRLTRENRLQRRFATLTLWRRTVRRWLKAEGYFQCCTCLSVKCLKIDAAKGHLTPVCKQCTLKVSLRNYHERGGAARLATYHQQHQEQGLRNTRKYMDRKARKSPTAMQCAVCSRVLVGGRRHAPDKPMRHLTLAGEKCEGHKMPGIPYVKEEAHGVSS